MSHKTILRKANTGRNSEIVKSTGDYMLIRREFFNPNKFDVRFERDFTKDKYIFQCQIPIGPRQILLKAGGWITLPHGYYIPFAVNGAPEFNLVTNYGDAIGVGNKLPSAPIYESRIHRKE